MPIQSTQYIYEESFLAIPRVIFTNQTLSGAARLLYIHLLDRSKLSEKNGLIDQKGIFVYCTIEEAAKVIGCRLNKAHDTFDELLEQWLIEKKRQGLGRANKYYVNADPKDAEAEETTEQTLPESVCVSLENQNHHPEDDLASLQNQFHCPEHDFPRDRKGGFQPIGECFNEGSRSVRLDPVDRSKSSTPDIDFIKKQMNALQMLDNYRTNTSKKESNNNQ